MEIKSKVIKGVKWTTISTIIVSIVAILKISILTRFLDKGDFGIVAIVTFILSFMELFNDMGISTAILHKQEISRKEYSSLYWVNLLFSVVLYSIVLLLSPLISSFYQQTILKTIIPILSLNLIFSGIGRQFRVILQKELNFKLLGIVDILSALISLIFAIVLAKKGFGIFSLVYSSVIQLFLSNALFIIMGLSKEHKIEFFCNIKLIKDFLRIGVYQVGGQIANYFNRDLDILIIGKIFSPQILGGYSLAKQLVFRPFQLINPIVIKVASPALAKFQSNQDLLKENYLKLLNIVSSVNIVIYVILFLFAPIIVDILYGSGFEEIYWIVRILCVYMVFRAIGNPVGSLVVATGRTDLDLKWNLFTLLITPFFVFLGSRFGIIGVTISLTISMIILFYPSWKYLVSKMIDVTFKEYFKSTFNIKINQVKKIIKNRN